MTSSFEFFFDGASRHYVYLDAAELERAGYVSELTGGFVSAVANVELTAPENVAAGAS